MTADVAVTSDSLCVLTRQYSSSQKVADDLCDVLAKAEEAATPKLRDKRLNDLVKRSTSRPDQRSRKTKQRRSSGSRGRSPRASRRAQRPQGSIVARLLRHVLLHRRRRSGLPLTNRKDESAIRTRIGGSATPRLY